MESEINQGLTTSVLYLHEPAIGILFQQNGESYELIAKGGGIPGRSQKNSCKPYLSLKKNSGDSKKLLLQPPEYTQCELK